MQHISRTKKVCPWGLLLTDIYQINKNYGHPSYYSYNYYYIILLYYYILYYYYIIHIITLFTQVHGLNLKRKITNMLLKIHKDRP